MAVITTENLKSLLQHASKVEGDVMEIGVFVAETFHRLAPMANSIDRKAFALDSFCGMDDAGEFDGDSYPKGRLSCDGVENFERIMTRYGSGNSDYECFEGYIPTCFEAFDEKYPDHKLCFALVDVDHYEPTVKSLDWIWGKISTNGILVLDDYFRGKDMLASKAIEEWIPKQHFMDYKIHALIDSQLYMEKL